MAAQFASAILLGRDRYEGYVTLALMTSAMTLFGAAGLALAFELRRRRRRHGGRRRGPPPPAGRGAAAPRRRRQHPSCRTPARLREAFRFGLLAWGGNLLQQLNYRFDVLILGAYAAASDVGLDRRPSTSTGVRFVWVLPHGLQMVIFPRTASLDAATQLGRGQR